MEPKPADLPAAAAQRIMQDPAAAAQIAQLLKADQSVGVGAAVMGNIDIRAGKVVYAGQINVQGDFVMQ